MYIGMDVGRMNFIKIDENNFPVILSIKKFKRKFYQLKYFFVIVKGHKASFNYLLLQG